MKNYLFFLAAVLLTLQASAQTKNHRFGITSGGTIQHYSGDLGNSFFKFNSCCFGAEVVTFGYYLDQIFDVSASVTVGDFGYWAPRSGAPVKNICPGCKGKGMDELRSRMVSGNILLKYKLNNGIIFMENAKIAPYLYCGAGVTHLADRMKRNCVNVGYHFSLNTGGGLKYNLSERFNIGYNLGISYFTHDKVYATVDDANVSMDGKKDMLMQNTLFLGVNF